MPRAPADRERGHILLEMVMQSPLLLYVILVKHSLFSVLQHDCQPVTNITRTFCVTRPWIFSPGKEIRFQMNFKV